MPLAQEAGTRSSSFPLFDAHDVNVHRGDTAGTGLFILFDLDYPPSLPVGLDHIE